MTIPKDDLYRLLDNLVGNELRKDDGKAFQHYVKDGWSLYFDPDPQDQATLARIASGEAYWTGVEDDLKGWMRDAGAQMQRAATKEAKS